MFISTLKLWQTGANVIQMSIEYTFNFIFYFNGVHLTKDVTVMNLLVISVCVVSVSLCMELFREEGVIGLTISWIAF